MKQTETRLSRETVIDGALALVDAEGLEALTIRRLAQELGVTPMALYWHFKNKDELLGGVGDRLWSLVDNERDLALPPLEQFRALMESLLAVLRAHPASATLLTLPRVKQSPAYYRTVETALEVLHHMAFTPEQAAGICVHALRTAIALVTGQPGFTLPQTAEETAEEIRQKRIVLEMLPPDRYPRIVEAAQPLTSCTDPDGYYDLGLDVFLAGVAALSTRTAQGGDTVSR